MDWILVTGIVFLGLSIVINVVMIVQDFRDIRRIKREIFGKIRQCNRVVDVSECVVSKPADPLNQTQFQQTINQAYNGSLYE